MIASGTFTAPHVSEGLLLQVDVVNRSVTVLLKGGPLTFDVPSRCEVVLNGDRVKLRMLQPRDRVKLTYCRHRGILTALTLEVSWRLDEALSQN